MPRSFVRCLALIVIVCLGLAGCRREVLAPGNPVAAVRGMAAAVKDNDLVRYSRLSMPPQLHQQMEARWRARLVAAAPATAKEQGDYARWMARLTAADAEQRLYRSVDSKLNKLDKEIGSQWPLMQATGGIFLNGLIGANDKLSPAEKAHAKAVASALLAWIKPALVTDRVRARQAIAVLTGSARELRLPTLQQTRQLEMIPALEKAGQALKAAKRIGRIYGLDADTSLAGVDAKLVSLEGELATLEVSYPLLGQTVKFEMQLLRRDGRWYSADAVRSAEAELVQPLAAARPPTP